VRTLLVLVVLGMRLAQMRPRLAREHIEGNNPHNSQYNKKKREKERTNNNVKTEQSLDLNEGISRITSYSAIGGLLLYGGLERLNGLRQRTLFEQSQALVHRIRSTEVGIRRLEDIDVILRMTAGE
jgi:hypothetical protein